VSKLKEEAGKNILNTEAIRYHPANSVVLDKDNKEFREA